MRFSQKVMKNRKNYTIVICNSWTNIWLTIPSTELVFSLLLLKSCWALSLSFSYDRNKKKCANEQLNTLKRKYNFFTELKKRFSEPKCIFLLIYFRVCSTNWFFQNAPSTSKLFSDFTGECLHYVYVKALHWHRHKNVFYS